MENRQRERVSLLGLPTDAASSFVRGAAAGPAAIREALFSPSSNLATERGRDLGAGDCLLDVGDLEGLDEMDGEAARATIEKAVARELAAKRWVLSLGGDHSVAYPILEAYGKVLKNLTVVQVDAHPDLYDSFDGDRYSHACPFARVMEAGRIERLIQVGVRTATNHQLEQAERFGVEIVPRDRWLDWTELKFRSPVYLSVDLDGLDPAFAPGVAHPEAGGLATREVLELIWGVPGLVGADVVELNPDRDSQGVTAAAAAKLVKELAGRLLE